MLPEIISILEKCLLCFQRKKKIEKQVPKPRLSCIEPDNDLIQEFCDNSHILDISLALPLISKHLPPIVLGCRWKMLYSTEINGFSLSNLYRKCGKKELPVLIFIKPLGEDDLVLGAYISCGLKVSDASYGDFSTFVFKSGGGCEGPRFYKWDGHPDSYFMHGSNSSLSVGSSNGRHGIWLDESLDRGRSDPCNTFGSPSLTPHPDFRIKILECWTIQELF